MSCPMGNSGGGAFRSGGDPPISQDGRKDYSKAGSSMMYPSGTGKRVLYLVVNVNDYVLKI